jgi:FkbM family methyltransferase
MLDFKVLVKKYDLKISGILQIGSHFWQERDVLLDLGVKKFVLVEPQKHAFKITEERSKGLDVQLFNCALSDKKGTAKLFTNTNNEGQSSSLLKPALHLQKYPDVTFEGEETVEVKLLDFLKFDRSAINTILVDVQGAEGKVFAGGENTLDDIDIIYSEINFVEMYEGCILVTELDKLLGKSGFVRVETGPENAGWSDALYLKKSILEKPKSIPMKAQIPETISADSEGEYLKKYPDVAMAIMRGSFKSGREHYDRYGRSEGREWGGGKIISVNPSNTIVKVNKIDVPLKYRPNQSIVYPNGNNTPFEKWFYQWHLEHNPKTIRTYLPIYWTAFYVNHQYGQDKKAIAELQKYIDKLDKSKKYFTIVQYDDNILNSLDGLDIIVYASGNNKPGCYPIPLLSETMKVEPIDYSIKDIFMSFRGVNTHPIRKKMVDELSKHAPISFDVVPWDEYIDELKHSIFALCPRGYGVTSFRLYEAMQYGAIPVYISTGADFWDPFNLPPEFYVKIREDEINLIPDILGKVNPIDMRKKVEDYFGKYFTFEKCAENIIFTLS